MKTEQNQHQQQQTTEALEALERIITELREARLNLDQPTRAAAVRVHEAVIALWRYYLA